MANFDIESFRGNFVDGARAYLFYMKPAFPSAIGNAQITNKMTYLVKSTSLPAATLENIDVPWQGYNYKIAGKYTYSEWTVSFNVDIDANVRSYYEDWMRLIHDPTSNIHESPQNYMKDQRVELIDGSGMTVMEYKLIGAWPSGVGASELGYDSSEILSFEVTFQYQYHVAKSAKKDIPYDYTPYF